MHGVSQRIANSCGCTVDKRQANEENSLGMTGQCSASLRRSYNTSKGCSSPSGSYCQNRIAHNGCCNCSRSNTCKSSVTACHALRSLKCSCSCSNEGQRKWLDYLWKMEGRTDQQKNPCRYRRTTSETFRPWSPIVGTSKHSSTCCDISRKFHHWPPNFNALESLSTNRCICCNISMQFRPWSMNVGPSAGKCPCIGKGHDTHYFCNATDQNNLVARIAAIRYKISRYTKWLAINLAILITAFADEDFPTIVHAAVITITFLNACYYVQNLVKLYAAIIRIKLEGLAYRTRNCLWEKNLPQDLTRYFEVGSEGSSRYWRYFSHLVSTLRTVRSSPVGRAETEMGMEGELRMLGDIIQKTHQDELKTNGKFEDARHRVPLMKRIKQPVCTPKQLAKYWRNYDKACEDEKVRLSQEQLPFSSGTPCKPHLSGNQNSLVLNQCNDSIYHKVTVPSVLRCSRYQLSCGPDVHPSPTIAVGSFHDFMKIHHGKDFCSSLHWVANLKFWLSNKIKEIVEQFDMANCLLVRHGASHAQIGTSSIADLHNAFRQNEELLTFMPLLEFLSLSHNQTYLVQRYRVLARQPCLTSYCWQAGGDQKGNWSPENGPSDSEIVLHFFCSYMDMKLPNLPFHPAEKRPFSDQYLIRSNKRQQTFVEIAIVQQWATPPHFNVIVKGRVYEIQGGSNNLFLALSYLIYCVKIYQGGKIGRVSLGRPGLDMLWIVGGSKT